MRIHHQTIHLVIARKMKKPVATTRSVKRFKLWLINKGWAEADDVKLHEKYREEVLAAVKVAEKNSCAYAG